MRKRNIEITLYPTIQANCGSLTMFGNFKWSILQAPPPSPTRAFHQFLPGLHTSIETSLSQGGLVRLGRSPSVLSLHDCLLPECKLHEDKGFVHLVPTPLQVPRTVLCAY